MSKVSYNELTRLTGFSYRTIRKRIDGLIPVGASRTHADLWDSKEALELIYSWKNKSKTPSNGDEQGSANLTEERAKLERARRIGQELKNAEAMKDLIPADEVSSAWGRIASSLKRRFLALPDRLAQMLETAADADDRRAIIDMEIKAILEGLAEGVE